VVLLFSAALLFILVDLPLSEKLPSLMFDPSPLEGPSTILEEILLFLVGHSFSEAFLFLLVGP
jgi:hypothetical protein